MIQRFIDRLKQLPLREPSLRRPEIVSVLAHHGVEPWFLYAYDEWRSRWHVWRGLLWAIKNVEHGGNVLETGCGCGWNLFWLAANGFGSLTGLDINAAAVVAGNELAQGTGFPVRLRCDNALDPGSLADGPFHLILALNWTYHVPEFELGRFLERYGGLLVPGGVLLLDTIEKSFNAHPNNRYLTSDWGKPEWEMRPSEYLHRFSQGEVREIAASRGYQIEATYSRKGTIPRSLYILRRS
ncbi:methyltransferase domain-containing protein [Oryzomonas japonica]|uniref:Methyltransferase domain-containing protein n=1 Tax=Oryzomonas japonica TaxID=2603858 RepID=A0A7J4ZPP0_9BACT|nr:class I SAM-dependent methyltransferase [Oryzomonas japonica]KAB0664863.1 methyltransferase domain-containing protein [Oryzomonas japonica]